MNNLTLILLLFSCYAIGAETQYVCEFNTGVKISNYKTDKPIPHVTKVKEKYSFFTDGKTSSFINLNQGIKSPAYIVETGGTVTFIENTTGDNFFSVSIFPKQTVKSHVFGAIYTFISYKETNSDSPDYYDPEQLYGSCIIIKK